MKQTRGSRSDRRHKERMYRSNARLSGSMENPPPPKAMMCPPITEEEIHHRDTEDTKTEQKKRSTDYTDYLRIEYLRRVNAHRSDCCSFHPFGQLATSQKGTLRIM